MSDWKNFSLGEIVEFNPVERIVKGTLAKKISMEKLQPFCREISGYELEKYNGGGTKFRNGDTIMARITPCLENGKTARIDVLDDDEIGFGSTEYIVFRAKENVTVPDFVYYLIRSAVVREPAIKSMVGTSGRQRVQTDYVKNIVIHLPPLETQKKIAAVLSALDDKIELNNAINKNLEEQAQAIFKKMFVDNFNPAWRKYRADEVFNISIGKTPPRKEHQWFTQDAKDITWVSISDIGNCGVYIGRSSEYLTTEAVKKFNVRKVPRNTVILSFKLTVGRVAITDRELTTNEAIAHFITNDSSMTEYVYLYLKNFSYQTMGSTSSIATAINSKIIKAMSFILPTEEELCTFHNLVEPLFLMILQNQQENKNLGELRDVLLPRLMSGEIDVSAVEILRRLKI